MQAFSLTRPGHTAAEARLAGLIGPNAITRVAQAVEAVEGRSATVDLFQSAGLDDMLASLPTHMVRETAVTALQQALVNRFGATRAATLSWIAGQRTADYLLRRRIPKLVQGLLKGLPARLAARILLAAIGRNAWTFAGSGRFRVQLGRPIILTFNGCPICRGQSAKAPVCSYYAGTFERLFQQLVQPDARVLEFACEAIGDTECRFRLDLG